MEACGATFFEDGLVCFGNVPLAAAGADPPLEELKSTDPLLVPLELGLPRARPGNLMDTFLDARGTGGANMVMAVRQANPVIFVS